MRYPPHVLDEIRARLPVSTVVGRKVRLKKEGKEWRGLSPFTSEKTPSFFVNDGKMRWFDFSSGTNGNVFDFVMQTEGLSFPEAVERLAAEAGVSLPSPSREQEARDARRTGLVEIMELTAGFFQSQLRGRAGEGARAYLARRELGEAATEPFRLGYAPRDRFALRDFLAGKGVKSEGMIEAGLLVHGEDIAVPYDRFRDRIMFPIADAGGRVIAFGGRALDPDAPAKYLNSPETPLFHKGSGLYNHHRARKAAHERARVIAVEGYVDVIAMEGAGFPETVAPLGTALTPDQCRLLWRMADEPVLCFDGDKAGRKAAWRAIDTALPLLGGGKTLRFALLPSGLDPDDLARSGGTDAIAAVLDQSRPLVDMLWSREVEAQPLDTPERRHALERRLRDATRAIPDPSLRRHYEEALGERAAQAFGRTTGARPRSGDGGRPRAPWRPNGRPVVGGRPPISEDLARSPLFGGAGGGLSVRVAFVLLALLNHPELIAPLAEEIAALPVPLPEADRMRGALLALDDGNGTNRDAAEALVETGGLRPLVERLTRIVGPSRLRAVGPEADPLDAQTSVRQALALHHREASLNTALRAAEADYAANPDDRHWERLLDIRAQLSNLEGMDASIDDAQPRSPGFKGAPFG